MNISNVCGVLVCHKVAGCLNDFSEAIENGVAPNYNFCMSLFKEIYTAYTICRLHKQFSKHQVSFEMQLGANLIQLTKELSERNYKLSPHHYFIVTKPKPREIFSAHFRDRVIHHYLVSKLTPFWEKKFSHSSFACRKGKEHSALSVNCKKKFIKSVRAEHSKCTYFKWTSDLFFVQSIVPHL